MTDSSRRFPSPADAQFKILCWVVRIALLGGLLIGLVFDLSQLEGKGWGARAVFYTLVVFVLPVAWRLSGKRFAYSYVADALLVAPFALDILGNLFGLYDSLESFDDILHFLNWALLTACFTVSISRSSSVGRLNLISLGTGFGATMIVLWELMEFCVMKLGTERLHLTYEDTVGDISLSTFGGFVSSLIVGMLAKRKRQENQPLSTNQEV